jgi:microtubule-associated protein-like 6
MQLAFVGKENNHIVSVDASTVYVHKCSAPGQWSDPVLVASSQNKSAITSISSPLNDTAVVSFVTAGEKVIRFWTVEGSKLAVKKGILGKAGKIQEYTCVAYVGDTAVVGTKNGKLYHFSGNTLKKSIDAHIKAVNVVSTFQKNNRKLLSGGRDGKIIEWDSSQDNSKLSRGRTWCMASEKVARAIFSSLFQAVSTDGDNTAKQRALIAPIAASVRSVCMHADGKRLVVGTQCSQIIELDANVEIDPKETDAKEWGKSTGLWKRARAETEQQKDGVMMNGHFLGELWGLAVHPFKNEFCTVGDDKTLRIWNMTEKTVKRWKLLDGPARACCYSNNGTKIAIGMGNDSKKRGSGTKEKDTEGRVIVFNVEDFSVLKDVKASKRWVSEVKFSPNDQTLAVGTHDSMIYLYDAANGFKPMKPFKKHSSYITHFDFSSGKKRAPHIFTLKPSPSNLHPQIFTLIDSKTLQSNCGAYELLFSNPKTGGQITSASSVKDTDWATWSCTLGWPVQGIWPVNSDGTDINMVDRSEDKAFLASADDFGTLKVFRYPCTEKGNAFVECKGHSSHVTNVKWSSKGGADHTHLVTAGGNDRCVLQWKVSGDLKGGGGGSSRSGQPNGAVQDEDTLLETNRSSAREGAPHVDDFDLDVGGGDEFTAIKPWLGAIVKPSKALPPSPAAPDNVELELKWVHGYQAVLSRNSLRYVAGGQSFVYPAAGVGVKMSEKMLDNGRGGHGQSFFMDHDDDVISLAVSQDLKHVATGQMGKTPLICIWDAATMESVAILKGFHQRAVPLLSFAGTGDDEKLMSVGDDNAHRY